MRFNQARYGSAAALIILMSSLPLSASLTTFNTRPPLNTVSIQVETSTETAAVLDSLRRDVAAHPADFITFETESSAHIFIANHAPEAEQEKDSRVVARGIFGYWCGKTLVVLPSLPTASRR